MTSSSKLFLILLSAFVVAGCSKKSNPSPSNLAPYVGNWYLVADTAQIYTYPSNGFVENAVGQVNNSSYMQLRADGSGTNHFSPDTNRFTYTVSGNLLISHIPQHTYNGQTYSALTDTLLIKKFAVTNLIFQSSSIDPPNGGIRYKHVYNLYYIKQ